MDFFEWLRKDQIEAYLARIGIGDMPSVSLESLNRLLFAQLTSIPFDSIDVWGAGICPSLHIADIYQKIVVNNRGGYCFEQNTLFRVLLNSLGFDAYQVVACLLNEDYSIYPPAHNVIICRLEGKKYLLDVGFGGPVPYQALELDPGAYGNFILKQDGGAFILERLDKEGTHPFIKFRDIPVSVTELIPLNFYISQNPESHFRHIIHVNQRKADGSTYVITGNEFKIYKDKQVIVRQLRDVEDLKCVLKTYYQIDPTTCLLRETL